MEEKMKKALRAFLLLSFLPALALANGLNLNSLGSRALTMGGAFVGLADDFSAIYWNPAGMSQFTTRTFGFYGTDIIPRGTYLLEVPPPRRVDEPDRNGAHRPRPVLQDQRHDLRGCGAERQLRHVRPQTLGGQSRYGDRQHRPGS